MEQYILKMLRDLEYITHLHKHLKDNQTVNIQSSFQLCVSKKNRDLIGNKLDKLRSRVLEGTSYQDV